MPHRPTTRQRTVALASRLAGRGAAGVALAACSFAIVHVGDDNIATVQVTPAGEFRSRDGRPMSVDAWRIDAHIADALIARFRACVTPLVLDYEHQTLLTESNGQPAPAAGFFRDLVWRDGEGLFATVQLTARAAAFVRAGEYLYFSPVFSFDGRTGAVLRLEMGALTNCPALDGMQPLALRAAARFGLDLNQQESEMDLIAEIRKLLGLPDDAADAAIIESLQSKLQPSAEVALRAELGIAADADTATAVAACRALKTGSAPDPARFAPVAVVQELSTEVAALRARVQQRDLDDLVNPAIADGRLLGDEQIAWARQLGESNIASLRTYLGNAKPIAALSGSQTRGVPPIDANAPLTADELAVCRATGVTPDDFAKARAA